MKTKLFWINLRTTEEERDQLRKDAHRHEMNVSEYIRWLVEREREAMKMTNYERIKNMSVEEMAESCDEFFSCPYGQPYVGCDMEEKYKNCSECVKHWLNSEVEE